MDTTWPSAEFAFPVVVKGTARGWFEQTDGPSWTPTYPGGITEEGAESNCVIFDDNQSGNHHRSSIGATEMHSHIT